MLHNLLLGLSTMLLCLMLQLVLVLLVLRKRPRIHTCFPDLTLCRLSPEISRHRRNRWTCLMPPKARHSGSHTLRPGNN
ncbi:hypothetical protein, partial [Thiolapillus sp.]|uniref:hypothetical protein n=1 Tax=Thiolapillus sp. TaxID=2017437 RepID=UPI003AF7D93F